MFIFNSSIFDMSVQKKKIIKALEKLVTYFH